jgi:hypothetical protein
MKGDRNEARAQDRPCRDRAILVLLVAGSIWFNVMDDRRAEAFRFALSDPANVLEQITAKAEASKTLSGSGTGLAVPNAASGRWGPRDGPSRPMGWSRGARPRVA